MTLRLTPTQFRTLVRSLFIAKRVVDGAELQDDTPSADMKSLITAVHGAAGDFDSLSLFESDPLEGGSLIQPEQESLGAIADWYDEFAFWDILEERLAMRDIARERTEAQWNWLPEAERNKIYDQHMDFYYEEFATNGVLNLRLVPPSDEDAAVPPWTPQFQTENEGEPEAKGTGKILEFPSKPKRKPGES